MTYSFLNHEVNIVIERKNNKNIYFRFKTLDTLTVTTHYLMSDKSVLNLIKKNEVAITKMYQKVIKKQEFSDSFMYLGKKYIVVYDESVKDVTFDNDYIVCPNEKKLEIFIKKETKRIFESEVKRINDVINDIPQFSLRIRKMTTRWGVCNRSLKVITLNSELIKRDISLLDYVIVHEMCHFYEGNHSKKFWEHVEYYYPKYKLARKILREE